MKNKKVLAIVMAVMTAASALVGCGATEATAPADTAVTTEKEDDATAEAAQTTDGEQVTITFMHDWPGVRRGIQTDDIRFRSGKSGCQG